MTYLLAAALVWLWASPAAAQDLDRDGLDDPFEQALLERFLPTFVVSAGECDGLPASFAPGTRHPEVLARDGTIHGRVFPAFDGTIEVQYFHLWARDCGRGGHALDAEHVSALLEYRGHQEGRPLPVPSAVEGRVAQPPAWTARLWYAAAHEDTLCDQSSGAHASALGAVSAGPRVYVSRGKHASYLNPGQCKWGCGGDACPRGQPLRVAALVNIGEPGAPLNGATWVASARWPLGAKLTSNFDPTTKARLDRSGAAHIISLMLHLRGPQAPVLAGDTAVDGLAHAGGAAGSALKKSVSAVARVLRLTR